MSDVRGRHGISKSRIMEEKAREWSIPIQRIVLGTPVSKARHDRPTIIDAGSPTNGLRFELMLQHRHFVVHTSCEGQDTMAHVMELGFEEVGGPESGPLGLDRITKDEWTMPLGANDLASVVRALELALHEEEMGLHRENADQHEEDHRSSLEEQGRLCPLCHAQVELVPLPGRYGRGTVDNLHELCNHGPACPNEGKERDEWREDT